MGTFGDSTPVIWSTGLLWDGNDNYQFDDEDEGWQEVGVATELAEHFHGHVSQGAPEPSGMQDQCGGVVIGGGAHGSARVEFPRSS